MHSKLTASVAAVALLCATRGGAQQCALDLDGSGTTTVNELIVAVTDALGGCGAQCALDPNGDDRTTIDELVVAVSQALNGCPQSPFPTPTRTPRPGTFCPLDFNSNNSRSSDRYCSYLGSVHPACVITQIEFADWQSDGSKVTLALGFNGSSQVGAVTIHATRITSISARIDSVRLFPSDETLPASGALTLPSNVQLEATVTYDGPCSPITYRGILDHVIP